MRSPGQSWNGASSAARNLILALTPIWVLATLVIGANAPDALIGAALYRTSCVLSAISRIDTREVAKNSLSPSIIAAPPALEPSVTARNSTWFSL